MKYSEKSYFSTGVALSRLPISTALEQDFIIARCSLGSGKSVLKLCEVSEVDVAVASGRFHIANTPADSMRRVGTAQVFGKEEEVAKFNRVIGIEVAGTRVGNRAAVTDVGPFGCVFGSVVTCTLNKYSWPAPQNLIQAL